ATNARLENQEFKNGSGAQPGGQPGPYIPPDIHPLIGIEDLAVHAYFHRDQIISQDFRKWLPEAQQALIEHFMDTDQAMQAMMAPVPSPSVGPPGAAKPPNQVVQGQNPDLGKQTPVQGVQ